MSLTHPTRKIAVSLYRRLEAEITKQCGRSYSLGVVFRCVELRSCFGMRKNGASAQASLMRLRIECTDYVQMLIRLRVSKVRNRLFNILCSLEDGEREWASRHLLPSRSGRPWGPILDPGLVAFLVEEMEDRLGRFPALS